MARDVDAGRPIWPGRAALVKGMLALADQGVVSLANFLCGVLLGRALPPEQFGLYALGFGLALFATELQVALIATPYMVFSPRLEGAALRRYTGSTLLHQVGLGLLAAAALLAAGTVLILGGEKGRPLGLILWTLAPLAGFVMLREFARRVALAHLRPGQALGLDAAAAAMQVAGIVMLGRLGLGSSTNALRVVGLACALAGVGWLLLNRRRFDPTLAAAWEDLGRNWALGRWVFLSGLLWSASTSLYPWLLTAFHGTAANAVWAAGLGTASLANPVLNGLQNLVGPKIAHRFSEQGAGAMRRFVTRANLACLLAVGPFVLALVLAGGPLVGLFYGPRYLGQGLLVALLGLNLILSAVAFSWSRALFALGRADLDFRVNLAALFVLFSAGLWLVRALGPLGVAWSLLTANAASTLVRYAFYRRQLALTTLKGTKP